MFSAQIMGKIYAQLLVKIQRANYDVFGTSIRLNDLHKLGIALRYWLGSRFALGVIVKRVTIIGGGFAGLAASCPPLRCGIFRYAFGAAAAIGRAHLFVYRPRYGRYGR